jgi:cytochrome c2
VAGKFPNDAKHLIRWLQDPPAMAPHTAMPRLGVSEQEATDMAAYLLALR